MGGSDPWEDPEFGADSTSFVWDGYGTIGDLDDTSGYEWKRPTEMGYDEDPSLLGELGKPVPNGIHQGGLGDCWFLSSNAAVAEVATRIKSNIANDDYNAAGIFRYRFWVKDTWYWVNVDDRLPSKEWGGGGYRPTFT